MSTTPPEDGQELTNEQKELLAKAQKQAEKEATKSFKGFSEPCPLCDAPRRKHKDILLCKHCDFVKFVDGEAIADPQVKS